MSDSKVIFNGKELLDGMAYLEQRIKEQAAMIAKQRAIINELKEEVERLLAAINDALEQEGEG